MDEKNETEDLDKIQRWLTQTADNEDAPFLFFLTSLILVLLFVFFIWMLLLHFVGLAGIYIYLVLTSSLSISGFLFGLAYFKKHRDSKISFTITLLNLMLSIFSIFLITTDWRHIHF